MRTISLRSRAAVIFDGLELLDGSGLVMLVDQTERRENAHEPLMRQLDLSTRHSYRVYVFVYVRMYVCVYVCIYCMSIMCVSMYVHEYVCMYVCINEHMYLCVYVCAYMCMCV